MGIEWLRLSWKDHKLTRRSLWDFSLRGISNSLREKKLALKFIMLIELLIEELIDIYDL